jgi:hypothetical protein
VVKSSSQGAPRMVKGLWSFLSVSCAGQARSTLCTYKNFYSGRHAGWQARQQLLLSKNTPTSRGLRRRQCAVYSVALAIGQQVNSLSPVIAGINSAILGSGVGAVVLLAAVVQQAPLRCINVRYQLWCRYVCYEGSCRGPTAFFQALQRFADYDALILHHARTVSVHRQAHAETNNHYIRTLYLLCVRATGAADRQTGLPEWSSLGLLPLVHRWALHSCCASNIRFGFCRFAS